MPQLGGILTSSFSPDLLLSLGIITLLCSASQVLHMPVWESRCHCVFIALKGFWEETRVAWCYSFGSISNWWISYHTNSWWPFIHLGHYYRWCQGWWWWWPWWHWWLSWGITSYAHGYILYVITKCRILSRFFFSLYILCQGNEVETTAIKGNSKWRYGNIGYWSGGSEIMGYQAHMDYDNPDAGVTPAAWLPM